MNTAEYIIKRLEELGVTEFFGLPGDNNLSLISAVEGNRNTKWVGCTNELNAGYAADGYARIRGYGALITTYGVGELSAINAIAGSNAENVPVVHIVGLPSTKYIENNVLLQHNFQEPDYQNYVNAFKSVTAATGILSRDNAKMEIDRVFKILVKERKPVYLAVPEDIAKSEISDKVVSYEWHSDRIALEEVADKIVQKISKSSKPVIIGDILIKRFDARIEYEEFVSKSRIPVSNFLMGTNLVDMDFDNYIGGYYGEYRNPIAQKYIEESDCMIAIGAIYSELNSFGHHLPYKINDHIAIYGNYTYVEGKKYNNVKMTDLLDVLTSMIEPKNVEYDKPNIGLKPVDNSDEQLKASYIYSRIQDFIKDNDIVVVETGTVQFGVSQMKFPPSAEIIFQALWSSPGWATSATLGVCMAKPQSRVVLITGDGAHIHTALEVGTMLRNGIKPTIIVINNKGYSLERLLSNNYHDKLNDIVKMNYTKLARAFEGDIWATKVDKRDDFDKALKVTQIMNKMCYVEACTDILDVPSLIKDIIGYDEQKAACKEPEFSDIASENEEQDKELPNSELVINFEYETVVHQALDKEKGEE